MVTPVLWLASAFIVVVATWAAPAAVNHDPVLQDTYYVVPRAHVWISLPAAMVAFAALYLLLDSIVRAPFRRGLRLAHLGLTLGGALLILSPPTLLGLIGMPRRDEDFAPSFAFWNWLASAGYALILAGLVVFAVVVMDSIRNRQTGRGVG